MRPSVPGYQIRPENRPSAKAFTYFYSLLPRVNSGDPYLSDPIEFRLRPFEFREFPVNFDADSQFFKWFIRFEVANEYALPAFTGGVYAAEGNTLLGVGTIFTSELRVGDVIWIDDDPNMRFFTVAKIISDTELQTAEFISPAISTISEPLDFGKMQSRNTPIVPWPDMQIHNYMLTGTISYLGAFGPPLPLVGVGTKFLTELVVGDKIRLIDDASTEQFFIVSAITDDLNATVHGTSGAAATKVAMSKFYTDYTDIEFEIFASGGGGQRFLGKSRVLGNQGTNGGGNPEIIPGYGALAAIRRPYLYGKSGAATVRIRNLVNDARRIHAHLFGMRIRI